jgi:hypothetical protein
MKHPQGHYDVSAIRTLADDLVTGRDFRVGCHAEFLAEQRVPAVVNSYGFKNVCIMLLGCGA